MSEERIDESLAAVEAAVASLQVKPTSLDRDRVIFLAGQASARQSESRRDSSTWAGLSETGSKLTRGSSPCGTPARPVAAGLGVTTAGWLWPLATAVSLVAAVTFGVIWATARPRAVERIVYLPVDRQKDSAAASDVFAQAADQPLASPLATDYLVFRQLILTEGPDAMPPSAAREPALPESQTITPRDAYNGSLDLDHSG